jgi:hypothetical protein
VALIPFDAQCNPGMANEATGGTVTLTNAATGAGTSTQGSFQLAFGTDALSGTFSAPDCQPLQFTGPSGCQ